MIVAQAELDQILDRKVRKRLLELPVRYGRFGERKRCPMRLGGVYHLKPPIPYDRFQERAEAIEPRKRAVLWLIARVQRWDPKPVTVTVSQPPEVQGAVWIVSFLKGDEGEVFNDAAVYLAPDGGFTTVAARQAVPGDPEYMPPFAEDLARARAQAREKRVSPQRELVVKMQAHAGDLQRHLTDMKLRNRARLIQKQLTTLASELDDGGTLEASDRAAAERPAASEGEGQPSGAASVPAQLLD